MKVSVLMIVAVALAAIAGIASAESAKDMDSHGGAMNMGDMAKVSQPAATLHHAVGTVKRVDAAKGSVTLSHGPVPTLNWPAMTMTFGVRDKSLLNEIAVGKKIAVDFVEEGSNYTIVKVKAS